MKAAIGSSGDAGHVSNLPSLRLDLQRRESRSSPPTVIPFDLRRLLAISDGLKSGGGDLAIFWAVSIFRPPCTAAAAAVR
ncbi:hypothetical protein JCGZ_12195 [Jatropha curcas]|uniref:Uncharacterized protein n=1 Tax=Jatropha curcas TaxID=180498 RepID=A0A067LP61_JATCU|nr:hypothetical protein JCGZ_12194 [Jatropha curcas]KDP46671.1 hypothetical protein JCGZ_12195 [Jatropha curcas]